jgi:hypothetical protein
MTNATSTETHQSLMLSIAKEVIQCRAARDGYEPETYDAEKDEEGYIVSILNALRQWSHAHDIDWEAELERAQEFFFEDLGVPHTSATIDVMKCPACGHQGSFYVEVSEVLLLFSDGEVLPDDSGERWDDASYCSCHGCSHAGRVHQFRSNTPHEKEKDNG